ncbi:MAG: hypothetical protein Q7N50_10300 [Armatimonadota bacterium]|nr:hypothetical protein [Armatimonadota bacterium]
MSLIENRKFFYARLSEIYRLGCIDALLGWDQQVYMPPKAAQARAGQLEYMASAIHSKKTDPEYIRVVDELYGVIEELSSEDQVNVRETKRILDIDRKLPDDFVSEMAQISSLGYSEWVRARPANDFKAVQPYLEKIVELSRRRCELVGYEAHPYDALLDIYEPGSKIAIVKPLLLDLAERLREIIPPISEKFHGQDELSGHYDEAAQYQLCRRIVENFGFSFETGRIDKTAHPFMTSIGPADFRITTRYDQANFLSSLYSTIHETGHALYELGLPTEWAGTPIGSAISLSVHESQSRIWENLVGRSHEFCAYLSGVIKDFFPQYASSLHSKSLWRYSWMGNQS